MINQDWEPCFFCKQPSEPPHHAFQGNGRRKLCDKYGLIYHLCSRCHRTGPDNVTDHPFGVKDMIIKKDAQKKFERDHGSRDDFIRIFGRNYL
jgi:hypothetical protein